MVFQQATESIGEKLGIGGNYQTKLSKCHNIKIISKRVRRSGGDGGDPHVLI